MTSHQFNLQQAKAKHLFLLIFSVLLCLCLSQIILAQSGRRFAKPTPVPTPSAEVKSSIKPTEKQPPVTIESLIVTGEMQYERLYNTKDYFDSAVKRFVSQVAAKRLNLKIFKR